MALVDKKSKLDRNYRNVEGHKVGKSLPQNGQYFTDKGASDSPFINRGSEDDHMISLLKNTTVLSTGNEAAATGLTYKSAPNAITEKNQDLNGNDPSNTEGSPIYFNGYGKGGKHQGKKLGGLDLHEALLQNAYTYNHGEGIPTTILGANENGDEGGALDLDKANEGQGYFHEIANPGVSQGKNLKGIDLHEALLTNHYTYKHGDSQTTVLTHKSGKSGGIYDLDGKKGPTFDSGVPSQVHGNPLENPNYTQLVEKYQSKVHNISGPYPFSGVYGPVGSSTRFQDLDGGIGAPNSTLGQFGGPYNITGPSEGTY
tara:strand:- start:248 stop:1189 length:942 start_codon:yes stop_codon:yes gene_type:complete